MYKQLLLLLCMGTLCWSCEGGAIVVNASSSVSVTLDLTLQPTMESNDSIDDNEIMMVCTIQDTANTPISNALVKIVGTDTPGNTAYSDTNGQCAIILPIIPDRNAESIMFVFEVQHENAETKFMSEFTNNSEVLRLLEVDEPSSYRAAYVGTMNVGWNRLGNTLKCTIPIRIK